MTKIRIFVLACFALIGLFDLVSGIIMATSDTPWMLNGMADAFAPLIQAGSVELAEILRGPYIRLAAFSFHVGVLTLYLAWRFRHDTASISMLFALYTLNGLGFAYYDHHFAAGSSYFYLKQAIGVVWVIALLAHIVEIWIARRSSFALKSSTPK